MKRKNVFWDGAERKTVGHTYDNVTSNAYVHHGDNKNKKNNK